MSKNGVIILDLNMAGLTFLYKGIVLAIWCLVHTDPTRKTPAAGLLVLSRIFDHELGMYELAGYSAFVHFG